MENPRSQDLLKSQSSSRAGSGKKHSPTPVQLLSCAKYTHAFPRHSCFAETDFPQISEIKVWSVVAVTCSFVLDVWGEEFLVISLSSAVGEEDLTEIKRMHQVWRGARTTMECWNMLF